MILHPTRFSTGPFLRSRISGGSPFLVESLFFSLLHFGPPFFSLREFSRLFQLYIYIYPTANHRCLYLVFSAHRFLLHLTLIISRGALREFQPPPPAYWWDEISPRDLLGTPRALHSSRRSVSSGVAKLFGYLCRMRGLVEFRGLDFRICARKREEGERVPPLVFVSTMISYCDEDGSRMNDDKRLLPLLSFQYSPVFFFRATNLLCLDAFNRWFSFFTKMEITRRSNS